MIRILRFVAGDLSISDVLCIGSYMGGPLQAALPFRHRILAAVLSLWLRLNPQVKGGSSE